LSKTVHPNGPRTPATQPSSAAAPATAHAPSVALPLAFALTGIITLWVGLIWLAFRPDTLATYHYNQYVIALTHLFVLGWGSTVVMGAVYQLVPVALETRLHSEKLALVHYLTHVVSFIGMVWMFWRWDMKQVGHYGSGLALGIGLFAYNIGRTLRRVPRWNVIATAVASAVFWLGFAVFIGLCVAAAKCTYESAETLPATTFLGAMIHGLRDTANLVKRFDQISLMHAHAHLGMVGFFLMLIVGVSFRLIPMFTLSELQSPRRAAWAVGLLNLGLAGTFVTVAVRSPWKLAFTGVILLALGLYGGEIIAMLRARKRKGLDLGVRQFLTALGLLGPVGALAVVLSWPGLPMTALLGQLENLYGMLGVLGVVTLAIVGMLHKILPFLVWYGRYSQEVGKQRVPSFSELYSVRLQAAAHWIYLAGLAGLSVGIVRAHAMGVRAGALMLIVSVTLLLANTYQILSHFWRPRLAPLVTPSVPQLAREKSALGEERSVPAVPGAKSVSQQPPSIAS